MSCKHKQIIRITSNTIPEYYCTAKQKYITERDCRGCMLYNPNIEDVVNQIFGGFKK